MSVNLGNSLHFDVHDASQGFSVWTENVPGCGANWFFVLPNVHGLKPDGATKFRGVAVKLGHGVAISWDGRVIRHCTSISHPDGMGSGRVGEVKDSHFRNHLYGAFTAAKERIVRAGRTKSAASYCTSCSVVDGLPPRGERASQATLEGEEKEEKPKKGTPGWCLWCHRNSGGPRRSWGFRHGNRRACCGVVGSVERTSTM